MNGQGSFSTLPLYNFINQEKMKKFICFLFCSFLMLFASLSVQASVIEPIPSKSDVSAVDVGFPIIQNSIVKIVPMDYMVMTAPLAVFVITESPAMRSRAVTVPKCPFRYLYKSKYCTHYSYTAYSRLITPY